MRTANFVLASVAILLVSLHARAATDEQLGYDPAADPFTQLAHAKAQAAADHKLILLVAGGDWCSWCHYLDAFIRRNPDVEQALESTFVVVHVNYSEENKNEPFFATLPTAAGYPHFWVLSGSGELLKSQNTSPLENGNKGYEKARFVAFIDEWKAKLDR
jgi:thiol:disulfide interchange protein